MTQVLYLDRPVINQPVVSAFCYPRGKRIGAGLNYCHRVRSEANSLPAWDLPQQGCMQLSFAARFDIELEKLWSIFKYNHIKNGFRIKESEK
jgi:hypothetical protein